MGSRLGVHQRERICYTQATVIVWSNAPKNTPIAIGISFVRKQC